MKKGDRVGAILSTGKYVVRFLGYGVYDGDYVPDVSWMKEADITNPKLIMDNGNIVWGYQCWWSSEEKIKRILKGYSTIIEVDINGKKLSGEKNERQNDGKEKET